MNSNTEINFEPLDKLTQGVNLICDAVKATLGPKGSNVLIKQPYKKPHVTKDGVTVARAIEPKDEVLNLATSILKQAAQKTLSDAGDGTTTSLVLAQAIFKNASKYVKAGVSPSLLKKGMDKAVAQVVSQLQHNSIPIQGNWDKVLQVATVAANNDASVGKLVTEALKSSYQNGLVTVVESNSIKSTVSRTQGFQFDRGYISPHFINNFDKLTVEFNDPLILITTKKIRNTSELVPAMEIAASQSRPLLIIADDIEAQGLGILVVNKLKAGFNVAAVKSPDFAIFKKSSLEDLSILCGATLISDEGLTTLQKVTEQDLGTATSVVISKDSTTIVAPPDTNEAILARIDSLKKELELSPDKTEWEKEKLQERIARLSGGISIIAVGAHTEAELKEKKDRVDDSLQASKAAIAEGISIGSGLALYKTTIQIPDDISKDEALGYKVIKDALTAPLFQILINAGESPTEIIPKISTSPQDTIGYEVLSSKYCDLLEHGIIDPTKVIRCALENASSSAYMLFSTAVTVSPTDTEEPLYDQM